MKIILATLFLLSFGSVQAQSSDLYKCFHLIQESHNDPLTHDVYAFVTEFQPCPSPDGAGGIQILFNSELKEVQSSYNTINNSNQLNDSTPIQVSNKISKHVHQHGYNLTMLHMVTEPECIWFKERKD